MGYCLYILNTDTVCLILWYINLCSKYLFYLKPPFLLFFFLFCFVLLFRAIPEAYGSSQARGQIRATAASPHHNHSNTRYKLCLQPTLHFMATLDP